jgi:methylphosphotriester-DNA--protein-cysteine methyltransferase
MQTVAAFEPSERLRPFVRAISVIETSAVTTRSVLPTTGLVLGFRYAGMALLLEGNVSQPLASGGLTGFRCTLRRMCTLAGGGVVVAAFRELGAAQFFDQPLHELFGSMVSLADLLPPSELSEVRERLEAAESPSMRAAIVDRYLCQRLRARKPDDLVSAAVAAIRGAGGALRIAALARQLGTSQDPLEKRFRRLVGASPKQLSSILRFRRVVAGYARGRPLTALAHEAGYYDQSHLIRDFRAITSEAPERFLRGQDHC